MKYSEPNRSTLMISKEIDTHRVKLEPIRPPPKIKISSPEDVVKFAREMSDYDRERMKILHLDVKNRVIGVENIAEGTLNQAIISAREAIKGSVLNNAAGVIILHNHPSGISQPSNEDDVVISKLRDAFNMMGIDVVDAIIVSKEGKGYYSYKEHGLLDKQLSGGSQGTMEDNTDISGCKSRAIELGRFLSELTTRSIEQPTHTVKEEELEKLRIYLDQLYSWCGISVEDQKTINRTYKEMWDAQVFAKGDRMAGLLSKLTSNLFHSHHSNLETLIKEGISSYKTPLDDACSTAMMAAMETMSKYCNNSTNLEVREVNSRERQKQEVKEAIIQRASLPDFNLAMAYLGLAVVGLELDDLLEIRKWAETHKQLSETQKQIVLYRLDERIAKLRMA